MVFPKTFFSERKPLHLATDSCISLLHYIEKVTEYFAIP